MNERLHVRIPREAWMRGGGPGEPARPAPRFLEGPAGARCASGWILYCAGIPACELRRAAAPHRIPRWRFAHADHAASSLAGVPLYGAGAACRRPSPVAERLHELNWRGGIRQAEREVLLRAVARELGIALRFVADAAAEDRGPWPWIDPDAAVGDR